jgi:RIO kinase 1
VTQFVEVPDGVESHFQTSYHPGRFEEGWLLRSLTGFYEDAVIVDVLGQVKGGKEANVYLCQAHPATGMCLLAAKVYRPRKFRNLQNDAQYREGREILSSEGGIVRRTDSRAMRAMKKGTDFGVELLHESWILYEFGTLRKLHALGARVPKPVACGGNAILMEFIGDETMAAPALHSIRLAPEERAPLFQIVLENIELMLRQGWVHGDLSAFNILYWQRNVTLIDFPQVTMALENRNAYAIFRRDVQRVCEYFRRQGVSSDPMGIADRMWSEHVEQGRPS